MVKVYEVGEVYFDGKTPVPSYDEYKRLVRKIDESDEELKNLACKNDTLAMENGKLKEQLEEANEVIDACCSLPETNWVVIDSYKEKWGVK